MRNNKKKGFTLMELLAIVVILGIISTIGIVSVNKVLDKSHKEYEVKQAKMVTTAAQSYFADNKSMLPLEVLTTKTVTLQELINKNYIGKVVDYKKREYDYQRSITTVRKMAANRYVYYSALYRNGEEKAAVDENPEKMDSSAITINLSLSDNNSYKKYNNDTSYYVKEKTPVDVKMSSSDKIAAYKYIIYKVVGSTEKKYKNSENIVIDKNSYDDKIVLSKENLTDGKYKLEVVAYGYDGIPNRKSISQIVIDATKPKCEIKVKKGTKGNNVENLTNVKWYIKDDLEIQMIQKDENLYKYKLNGGEYKESTESSIPINFNSYLNNKVVEGYSIDKAGNICTCNSEPIYYDPTPPNCSTEISNSNWTNQKVTLTGKCNDSGSDCVEKEITKEIDYEVNEAISPGIAKDKAGNSKECSKRNVKIDKTAPTCTTIIEGTHSGFHAWYKSDVKFVGYCSDTGGSTCKENSVDWTYSNNTEGGQWGSAGIVEDNAGNKKNCDSYIYGIDTLAPTCGTPVNGVVSCTDNYGGSGTNDISYDQEESGVIDLGSCIDNVGNSSYCGTVTLSNIPTETVEGCSISYISIENESQGKWWNKSEGLNLEIEWDTDDTVEKLVRTYDGAESTDITSVGANDTSYTTGDYLKDRNTKVCYQLVTSKGCKSKICTRVKIDKTPPTHSEVCACQDSAFASSSGVAYKYVQKMKLYDEYSGLSSSTWEWSSNGSTYNNGPIKNDFYNGRHSWFGYIGVSTSGGPYKYTITDVAGNKISRENYLNGPVSSSCDCSSHTS